MNNPDIAHSAIVLNSKIGNHCMVADGVRFCYSELGDYSYVSRNSNVFSTRIGKFTSISWNVSIGPANHDYGCFSSHSMLFAARFGMLGGGKFYDQYEGNIEIGNDVWIGCNAVILRKPQGIKIGDGAVIGANAIVSKDVPPYAIVVGKDRIIKYRFDEEIIKDLLELQWWNMPEDVLRVHIEDLSKQPTKELIEYLKTLK